MIAAKIYSAEDVGLGMALISSMGLLSLISRFGLDNSIIRFFPLNNKSKIFSTSIILSTFFIILFGLLFVFFVDHISPELVILKSPLNMLIYIIVLSADSMTLIVEYSFIAIRKAKLHLIQSIIFGSRILFLIPFITLGAIGIFSAVGVSFILAFFISYILLLKSGIKLEPLIDIKFLRNTINYSFGSYIGNLFISAPALILPILVLNILGPEQAAYYYVVYSISVLLFMIPQAISMSLFVEGSHDEDFKRILIKALFGILITLIPAATIIFFFGDRLLNLFGPEYSIGGFQLLKVMVIASFFIGINSIYISMLRIFNDIKRIIFLNSVVFLLLIVLGYLFVLRYGIIGIGYAWVVSYLVSDIWICIKISKKIGTSLNLGH